jgi:hypothetical protein
MKPSPTLERLLGDQGQECGIGELYDYELSGDTLRFFGLMSFHCWNLNANKPINELVLSGLKVNPCQIADLRLLASLDEYYIIKVAHSVVDGYQVTIINGWNSVETTFVCENLELIERYYTASEATQILQMQDYNHFQISKSLDSIKDHIPGFEYKSNMDRRVIICPECGGKCGIAWTLKKITPVICPSCCFKFEWSLRS